MLYCFLWTEKELERNVRKLNIFIPTIPILLILFFYHAYQIYDQIITLQLLFLFFYKGVGFEIYTFYSNSVRPLF